MLDWMQGEKLVTDKLYPKSWNKAIGIPLKGE
jgi:hypothetical protein